MEKISLLKDKGYRNGFNLKGLGGTDNDGKIIRVIQFGTETAKPSWTIGQWGARYSYADDSVTTIKESQKGVFELVNPTNHFTVDTNKSALIFECTASKCYDVPRKANQPWHHLLIETGFTDINNPDRYTKLSEISDIQVTTRIQFLKFEDKMNRQADPEVHAAQFLLYLTVHNANKESKGFGEMIWFGFCFFDNRKEWEEESSQFDIGTQALIVGAGNKPIYTDGVNMFRNGKPYAGEDTPTFSVKLNFLDMVKKAHSRAKREGYFQNTEFDDLYISGMNIGWEVAGTYDVAMQLSDFDIVATTGN